MHQADPYMPPFPGNETDLARLGAYLEHLQHNSAQLHGAQEVGIAINPQAAISATTGRRVSNDWANR
jgi:hypothetical protein